MQFKKPQPKWVAAVQRVRILRIPIIGSEMKTKELLYYCRLLTVDDVDALLERLQTAGFIQNKLAI